MSEGDGRRPPTHVREVRYTVATRRPSEGITGGTRDAYCGCVTTIVYEIKETVEHDERIRTALLAAFAAVLAVAFMVLLISDQVQAAAL